MSEETKPITVTVELDDLTSAQAALLQLADQSEQMAAKLKRSHMGAASRQAAENATALRQASARINEAVRRTEGGDVENTDVDRGSGSASKRES